MRFDKQGNPLPPTREEQARSWLGLLMLPLAALVLTVGGSALLQEWRTTTSLPVVSAMPSAAETAHLANIASSLATIAVASPAVFPSELIVLTPTPVPLPPRPRSTRPAGPGPCPDDPDVLPNGTLCQGVKPKATSTPYPTCTSPAIPGDVCMVRNSRTAQTPTPASAGR